MLIFCCLNKYILNSRIFSILKLIYILWNGIAHFTNLTKIQEAKQVAQGFTLNWKIIHCIQREKKKNQAFLGRRIHLPDERSR